ncbi:DUF6194 family protein [Rhodococcus olei]
MTGQHSKALTFDETRALAATLAGVAVVTASAETGAPEAAWGDVFVFDAGTDDRRFPFATIVTRDQPGFDTASDLDRPGVFRLNVHVGRDRFRDLIGYGPAEHAPHQGDHDYREPDRLLPHPVYAAQSWVSIVNPGPRCTELARDLLAGALDRERRRRGGR